MSTCETTHRDRYYTSVSLRALRDPLADIVELSGLRRETMSANLLDDLMTSAKTSEARLAQVLAGQRSGRWQRKLRLARRS